MPQIAYLIETPHISNIGKLQSKSLRAYEVEWDVDTTNAFWSRTKVISTGKVFILKDNIIIEKRTKAKLGNKYIGNSIPTSSVADIPHWNSRLFTSPELALLAKAVAIKSRTQTLIRELEDHLANAQASLTYASTSDDFVSQYPEHLV